MVWLAISGVALALSTAFWFIAWDENNDAGRDQITTFS